MNYDEYHEYILMLGVEMFDVEGAIENSIATKKKVIDFV